MISTLSSNFNSGMISTSAVELSSNLKVLLIYSTDKELEPIFTVKLYCFHYAAGKMNIGDNIFKTQINYIDPRRKIKQFSIM